MTNATNHAAVRVRGLRVNIPAGGDIIDDVSFDIMPGEVLGLVGESGSGKTTVAMALMAYARGGAEMTAGEIWVQTAQGPQDMCQTAPADLRRLRGDAIAYVPQDPASALNPAIRVGEQIAEVVRSHRENIPEAEITAMVARSLEDVGLPSDAGFRVRYPHQLSGGQQQRIGIAMAFVMRPKVIVLDEPTTGLDVTTQNKILEVIRALCDQYQVGALHVTHDFSVIATLADRVMVMYSGRVIELGRVQDVLGHPLHPYTRSLLNAVPQLAYRNRMETISGHPARPGQRPTGCFYAPRCGLAQTDCHATQPTFETSADGHGVRCAHPTLGAMTDSRRLPDHAMPQGPIALEVVAMDVHYRAFHVLKGVSFRVLRGECVALVGASGSGKSTLSRAIIGLTEYQGAVILNGQEIPSSARKRTGQHRRKMQYIFQSPFNSLNPRKTVASILGLVYDMFETGTAQDRHTASAAALAQVGLDPATLYRFASELSGGERQRVSIARALMSKPEILVCDEITSALDVSVQAAIINLLEKLRHEHGLTIIFVSHDLALVRNLADRILVLNHGMIVEHDRSCDVIDAPKHSFTRGLIESAKLADLGARLEVKPAV